MAIEVDGTEFIHFCESASSMEVIEKATAGNIRGLDKLAINNLSRRGQLPAEVKNMLLVYFFNEYANTVYKRTDLVKLHDHWVSQHIDTIAKAERAMKKDIRAVMNEI